MRQNDARTDLSCTRQGVLRPSPSHERDILPGERRQPPHPHPPPPHPHPSRYLPEFRNLSAAEFAAKALHDGGRGPTVVGWKDPRPLPRWEASLSEVGMFGLEAPVWRPLDVRYDPFVGNCECMPERDAPEHFFSVHFSCLQLLGKPSSYESELAFMSVVNSTAMSCTRHYYLAYYDFFVRAHGRLPPPLWQAPPVPRVSAAHDRLVALEQAALIKYYQEIAERDNRIVEAEMAEAAAAAAAAVAKGSGAAAAVP